MQDFKMLYERMDKDVRNALWQWIIDHSHVDNSSSQLSVKFYLKDEDDLWKRVYYRYTGQFERYNKEEKESKKNYTTFFVYEKRQKEFTEKTNYIDKSNNLYLKFILFLNRKTRKIIKNIEL